MVGIVGTEPGLAEQSVALTEALLALLGSAVHAAYFAAGLVALGWNGAIRAHEALPASAGASHAEALALAVVGTTFECALRGLGVEKAADDFLT